MITVEDGVTPPNQTEHLMNSFFQPSLLPPENRPGDNEEHKPSSAVPGQHITHSTLPISPGVLSTYEASTVQVLPGDNHQYTSPPLSAESEGYQLPDSLHTIGDHHFQFPQVQQQEASGSDRGGGATGGMNYRQLMQQSISQGMPSIMNRVINENRQNMTTPKSTPDPESRLQVRRATIDGLGECAPSAPRHKPLYYSPGMGHKGGRKAKAAAESMVLRTLVYSPMESASRKFPEFVFTPTTSRTIIATESTDGEDNQTDDSLTTQGNVNSSTVTVDKGGHLCHSDGEQRTLDGLKDNTKSNFPLAKKLECDYEVGKKDEAKLGEFKSQSRARSSAKGQSSNDSDLKVKTTSTPYPHHRRTSRSVPTVMFETTLTVPFRYHSRASLYPSFLQSVYYSTEMDIMESLHTLLDIKFKHQQPTESSRKQMQQRENTHKRSVSAGSMEYGASAGPQVPSTGSLMYEARKSNLIFSGGNQQKRVNTSLKRPSSFHVRRTGSDNTSDLDSTFKREFLMRKAAEAIKQRQIQAKKKEDSYREVESDLDAILEQQQCKPEFHTVTTTSSHEDVEQTLRQIEEYENSVKSMENLTLTDTLAVPPSALSSSSYISQRFSAPGYGLKSSSNSSLQALSSKQLSAGDHPSGISSLRRSRSNVAPERSRFHESSKNSQSLEALYIKSAPQGDKEEEELLYTFRRRRRPVTVLMRSHSSLSIRDSQVGTKVQSMRASSLFPNLSTMKSISSQDLADVNEPGKNLNLVGARSQKRFSRNRPTSAPSSRSSNSGNGGLHGLLASIHSKADKLWWNEL